MGTSNREKRMNVDVKYSNEVVTWSISVEACQISN